MKVTNTIPAQQVSTSCYQLDDDVLLDVRCQIMFARVTARKVTDRHSHSNAVFVPLKSPDE